MQAMCGAMLCHCSFQHALDSIYTLASVLLSSELLDRSSGLELEHVQLLLMTGDDEGAVPAHSICLPGDGITCMLKSSRHDEQTSLHGICLR